MLRAYLECFAIDQFDWFPMFDRCTINYPDQQYDHTEDERRFPSSSESILNDDEQQG